MLFTFGTGAAPSSAAVPCSGINDQGRFTLPLSLVSHSSVEFSPRRSVIDQPGFRRGYRMHDWVSDWKRWSRAERCFAIMLVIIALALPLGLLIAGERIGS